MSLLYEREEIFMCGTWTQADYREDADIGVDVSIIDYVNDGGDTAIMVRDADGDYINVYSTNGEDNHPFWNMYDDSEEAQKGAAVIAMAERGFRLAGGDTTQPLGVLPVTTSPPSTEIVVEGKTLLEWKQEGVFNEGRKGHIHPSGSMTDKDAFMAFVASCTDHELKGIAAMLNAAVNPLSSLMSFLAD
jgi:hypothetical protein